MSDRVRPKLYNFGSIDFLQHGLKLIEPTFWTLREFCYIQSTSTVLLFQS